MPRNRRTLTITAVAVALALAACGGDDGDAGATGSPGGAEAAPAEAAPAEADAGGGSQADAGGGSQAGSGGGDGDWLADVGLDHKGEALVGRVAERYEIIDDVLHLHVGEEAMAPAGTECMIVNGVLSDGETGVIHRADGSEETC